MPCILLGRAWAKRNSKAINRIGEARRFLVWLRPMAAVFFERGGEKAKDMLANGREHATSPYGFPQHFLYFVPLPHGHAEFRAGRGLRTGILGYSNSSILDILRLRSSNILRSLMTFSALLSS